MDFKTEGFLNSDYYQIVIIKPPDKKASSLIDMRESAYLKSKNSIRQFALEKLTLYCFNLYLKKFPDIHPGSARFNSGKVKEGLTPYINTGYIYQEYYTDKAEAVLVFRIFKPGLKGTVMSLAGSAE